MPKKPTSKLNHFQQADNFVRDKSKEYPMHKYARKPIKRNITLVHDESSAIAINPKFFFHKLAVKFFKKKNVFVTDIHNHPKALMPSPSDIELLFLHKYNYGVIYNYLKTEHPVGCIVYGIKNKKKFTDIYKTAFSFFNPNYFEKKISELIDAKYSPHFWETNTNIALRRKSYLDVYKEIGINLKFIPNEGYKFNKETMTFEKK